MMIVARSRGTRSVRAGLAKAGDERSEAQHDDRGRQMPPPAGPLGGDAVEQREVGELDGVRLAPRLQHDVARLRARQRTGATRAGSAARNAMARTATSSSGHRSVAARDALAPGGHEARRCRAASRCRCAAADGLIRQRGSCRRSPGVARPRRRRSALAAWRWRWGRRAACRSPGRRVTAPRRRAARALAGRAPRRRWCRGAPRPVATAAPTQSGSARKSDTTTASPRRRVGHRQAVEAAPRSVAPCSERGAVTHAVQHRHEVRTATSGRDGDRRRPDRRSPRRTGCRCAREEPDRGGGRQREIAFLAERGTEVQAG